MTDWHCDPMALTGMTSCYGNDFMAMTVTALSRACTDWSFYH